MTDKNLASGVSETPQYSIGDIMELLKRDELAVRKLLIKAGVEIEELKSDPSETIRYKDFRILWLSIANRREGRLLANLLIEESGNWLSKLIRKRE